MSGTPNQNPEDMDGRSDQEQIRGSKKAAGPKQCGGNVFGYLAILFAVAFFMLLLAYFMQQRNTEVAMSGLRDSISQFQTVDELKDENEDLKGELQALQSQIDELEAELEDERAAAEAAGQENAQAILYFWLLDSMFRDEHYAECAQLLQDLDHSSTQVPPNFSLTTESGVEYDAKARYEEICTQLIELGYLSRGEDGALSAVSLP